MVETIWQSVDGKRDDGSVVLQTETLVLALLAAYVVAIGLRALSGYLPTVVVAPPVVLALTFVPGILFLLALGYEFEFDAVSLLYALGSSLMLLMIAGLVLNVTLPVLGYDEPLSAAPLAVGIGVLVAALAAAVWRRGFHRELTVPVQSFVAPVPLALLALPLVSVLATSVWNRHGQNEPLLLVLTVVAFLPLALVTFVDERWYALGIWSMALAGLYHASLFKYNGFGGNPAGIWTWSERRWTPGVHEVTETTSELLQNGVLFPLYAHLADVQILLQYDVVNPFFVGFLPVALFVAFRSFVPARAALLGAAVFVAAHPFYIQYPPAGRAATPVLFLALLGVLIGDRGSLTEPTRAVLGLLFGSGVVVSHYGTSYFVMFALLSAAVALYVFTWIDQYADPGGATPSLSTPRDWSGNAAGAAAEPVPDESSARSLVNWTYVGWYSALAVAWYFFLAGGQKFGVLPNHTYDSIMQLFGDDGGTARSAARVQRDYGSAVIDTSRRLYFVLAALMGVGLLFAYVRRFYGDGESLVDDTYLAVASALLGFFGMTFVVRNWGGGRPMMIAFTFTAIFAVVGLAILGTVVRSAIERRGVPRLPDSDVAMLNGRAVLSVFGLLLALMLLLNTGVVSATVGGGDAPSSVPLKAESDYNQDVALHVWMVEHFGGHNAVGDSTTNGQTDWYRPQIVAQADPSADYGGWKPRGKMAELSSVTNTTGGGPGYGYLLATSHNYPNGSISREPPAESVPFASLEPPADQHSKIYATGSNAIYFRAESAT